MGADHALALRLSWRTLDQNPPSLLQALHRLPGPLRGIFGLGWRGRASERHMRARVRQSARQDDEDAGAAARRIKELATLRFGTLGPAVWKDDRAIGPARDGAYSMASPLPSAEFGRPIAEIYIDNPYSFYTIYLSDRLNSSRGPPTGLVKAGAGHIISMVRAAQALSRVKRASLADAYPTFRNRRRVAAHIRRERSSAQAEAAKQRDEYTCTVCRVNYSDLYGALGNGFAEAHHIVPLASIESTGSTKIDDLRTVCANCHRMLHLMKGDRDDIKKLRVLFTGNWPKVRGVNISNDR